MKKKICTLLILLTSVSLSFSQITSDHQWLYKDGEKFFPIGIWYTRGYDINRTDGLNIINNEIDFIREFGNFNTMYVDRGLDRSFFKDKVLFVGNGDFTFFYKKSNAQTVEKKAEDASRAMINYWADSTINPNDYIYMLDEPLGNGILNLPGINQNLDKVYTILKKWKSYINNYDPGVLTFFDHKFDEDRDVCNPCPKIIDLRNELKVDLYSHQHYSINGNAINNSLKLLNKIKFAPKTPSFLFLDADHEDQGIIDIDLYSKGNKAKAYTSIIHGATGVLFWREGVFVNDNDYTSEDIRYKLWERTKGLALELKNNQHIFKGELLNSTRIGNVHSGLFKVSENEYYYIVVNGSITENGIFHLPNQITKTLLPQEVYIVQPDIKNIPFLNYKDNDDILIRNSGNTVNESKFYVALSNGTEFPYSSDTLWEEGFGVASQELKIGDFNGDSKDDLLIRDKNDSKYYVSLSNGINEFKTPWPSQWLNNFGNSNNELHIGDFNGDGRDDLLIRNKENSIYSVKLSNGIKFLSSSKVIWEEGFGVASQELKIGDFNGDGMDDILLWNKGSYQSDSKYHIALSNGIDEFRPTWPSIWLENFGKENQDLHIGDFNGDGKDDLLIRDLNDSKYFVALSNGTKFPWSSDTEWEWGFGEEDQELEIGDFNGDGMDDILLWKKGTEQIDSQYRVAISNGTNNFEPTPSVWLTNFGVEGQELQVGNFDGKNLSGLSAKRNLEKKFTTKINFNPNPFKEKLFIKLSLDLTSNVTINIFGINGNQIIKQKLGEFSKGETNISIPLSILSKLTKGIYIAKILVENKSTKRIEYKKIIKFD